MKTVGKWFLGFAFVVSLFTALSNKLFMSALLWAAMTAVLFLPRERVKEKFKVDVSNKAKVILIFIGFIAASTLNPEVTGKTVEQPQGKPAEVKQVASKVAEPKNIQPAGLSATDKKSLQDFYKKFISVPNNADKQYELWSKSLSSGSSPATAYMNANVLINLNDEVRTNIRKLEAPAFLSDDDKAKINEAKTDLSTAYYTRNDALEQGKKYLNTQDLEALQKFKDKVSLSSSFTFSALGKLMEVLTTNKVDLPKL
ncbi:MAG: hypothetical protein UT64_C0014G0008 [Candidatus Falkowbacteria bacterium GW2011_GWF2_39_8]|uniref:Uncharacterized protein n=1 Tax=Candidatus Falkowbacteria bacterium GW2011_GWF2_39_8 TaxID=1618642 RepID=A0A0G0SEK6_9BACT|nr:MAG: hypothetical protein UT64_C0014G0008 [Candidatus Falkowbacteria bacterium GW2011_GWF2_39_8]